MKFLVRETKDMIQQWDVSILFGDSTGNTVKDILPLREDEYIYKERKDFEKLISELRQQVENYNAKNNIFFEEMFGRYKVATLLQKVECVWEFRPVEEAD